MKANSIRAFLGLAGLSVLAACGGGSDAVGVQAAISGSTPVLQLEERVADAVVDPYRLQIKQMARASQQRVAPNIVTLPELSAQKVQESLQAPDSARPVQIGFARDVLKSQADTAARLAWQRSPDGTSRAAIGVRSPAALGLRMGLLVSQMPPGTLLRVYGPDDAEAIEIHGNEVLRTIQQNLDAGIEDVEARTYWLPTVNGDAAVLEFELAPSIDPAWLKVSLPQVSHLVTLETDPEQLLKASGSCNIDVMCSSARNDPKIRAVAHMRYVKSGGTYICTGTLMNNTRQDNTPYFLSAHHCISSQSTASTLETFWNYRTSSCGSNQAASDFTRVSGGAQLLWSSGSTDTSFMRLNGALPSGAVFAGWDARAAQGSGSVYAIHHPDGDPQKYSAGVLTGFMTCTAPDAQGSFRCGQATSTTGTYLNARFSEGTTEGGSSGGALFSSAGQVVGQLFGGSHSCTNPGGTTIYGRLDLAFEAALHRWLAPQDATPTPTPTPTPGPGPGARAPVYRFYNTATGAHFYTNNALERDFVIATYPVFKYEGPAFTAVTQSGSGLSPVFRFFNQSTGAHFYTINAAERDYVMATYPVFKYEGPTWFAQTQAGNGASPMFRFYNRSTGTHFYTINQGEADYVRNTYPVFSYEGAAYYAWTN